MLNRIKTTSLLTLDSELNLFFPQHSLITSDKSQYSNQTKEIEDEIIQSNIAFSFLIISPFKNFIKRWNLIKLLILFYSGIIFPVFFCFYNENDDSIWLSFEITIDALYVIEIIFNFLTAKNHEKILIYKRKEIAINYLKKWFLLDFFSIIPFYLFINDNNFNFQDFSIQILNLFRMNKVIRIFKLNSMIKKLLKPIKINNETKILIYHIYLLIILIHLLGCLWGLITKIDESDFFYESNYNNNFYSNYISSVYFMLTLLIAVGYGNITPKTNFQKILVSIFMFLGVAFYGYLFQHFRKIFKIIFYDDPLKKKNFFSLLNFGKEFEISNEVLQNLILNYNNSNYSKYLNRINIFNKAKNDLFKDFPNELIYEICKIIYGNLLKKIEFFKEKPKNFMIKVLLNLEPIFLKKGDKIYFEGDLPTHVYFIQEGSVISKCKDSSKKIKSLIFSEGSYFGYVDSFLKKEHYDTVYVNSEKILIWKINKNVFFEILKEYPKIFFLIEKSGQKLINLRKSSANISDIREKKLLPINYFNSDSTKIIKLNKKRDKRRRNTIGCNIILKSLELNNNEETQKNINNNESIETNYYKIEKEALEKVCDFFNDYWNFNIFLVPEDVQKIFRFGPKLIQQNEKINDLEEKIMKFYLKLERQS